MKAAELFMKYFENEGVNIYGISGEENTDVIDTLLVSKNQFETTRYYA